MEKIFFTKADILAYLKYMYETRKKEFNNVLSLDRDVSKIELRLTIQDVDNFIRYMKSSKRHQKNKKNIRGGKQYD